MLSAENASFFHSSAWARVLVESYGYKPLYFASLQNGNLAPMAPFMEIDSRLTGKRGVSLPFTDECPRLAPDNGMFQEMVQHIIEYGEKAGWKYIEWRDGDHFPVKANASDSYFTHELDLMKSENELFRSLRDSTRRNIQKGHRKGVSVEISRSGEAMSSFCRLNCMTRQRHGLPPQPFSFFTKIFDHIISKGQGTIVSAVHSGKRIASSVFFHFGERVIYKYGASDLGYQHLRPNNLILWESIRLFRKNRFVTLNLGRTDPEDQGLLQFKRGWGAQERLLEYHLYGVRKGAFLRRQSRTGRTCKRVFALTPLPLLKALGSLLYRHAG